MSGIPLAVLDVVPISSGSTAAEALRNSVDLVQRTERFGYARYWFAEHHLNPGVAGTSPAVVLASTASATSTIRLGSGAVQLGHRTALSTVDAPPTTTPVIDGRTPNGLPVDILALLRGDYRSAEGVEAHAIPGEGADVQVWILGSSGGRSAQVAGRGGLRFAADYHVSPATVLEATEAYRAAFGRGRHSLPRPRTGPRPTLVRRGLQEATGADEPLITTITHRHADRVRSYELLAEEWRRR
ncbi:hypothetical protein GCM10022420_039730 [Streptomyces iranensis]|uniref:Alkanesulfonate monooxygenase SsuD/methylene tetrahydromethanopterin reductase-like flavin-dependent oxidoreductase (Luciferase family) n=1 Tax=Streptomyces iranensis TaxID=576784 RepID=A0A060ZKQ1_9ACTN|nr:alkanesulfonate monooxygenase SsuD/methylene tetrahydromethanopterin reductase-like flavin-dependent oxidoreductase (luciferase family) [Streptomyces iranensis]CDR02141.1 Luciferase-like monooxygenase [Streptomyces iranensis]